MPPTKKILATTTFAIAVTFLSAYDAQARLGESFATFRTKIARNYKFKSERKNDQKTYYMFSLVTDPNSATSAPGYAGGMTVTVMNGHITGQSLALRLGENYEAGKSLASTRALDFVYEALGKPMPTNQQAIEKEREAYSSAIDQVLANTPQNLRYPGFNGVITLSQAPEQTVIIAATSDAAPPPGGPEPVNKANK